MLANVHVSVRVFVHMNASGCVRVLARESKRERETLSAMGGVDAAAFREGKQS